MRLNKPIVGMASTVGRRRLLAGGLRRRHLHLRRRRRSSAPPGTIRLNKPIVGMAATPDDAGLLAGGLRRRASSASATPSFYGSTGAIHLNKPIVGMAATPDGGGYWLVASDGGIFTFGDAQLLRLDRGHPSEQAHRRHGGHSRRWRLLAGGLRRRPLQLRRRPLRRELRRRSRRRPFVGIAGDGPPTLQAIPGRTRLPPRPQGPSAAPGPGSDSGRQPERPGPQSRTILSSATFDRDRRALRGSDPSSRARANGSSIWRCSTRRSGRAPKSGS